MEILNPELELDRFFRELARAPSRVLLLDYDGTLAPFRVRRDRAVPYPGVRERIAAIRDDGTTRVVVISGRSLEVLTPLLGLDPAPELWGSHGWERRLPGGETSLRDPGVEARRALEAGAGQARRVAPSPEAVERKPASVAFHLRGMEAGNAATAEKAVRSVWAPLAAGGPLEIHEFDGGVELRVEGWDKGCAVELVLGEEPADAAVAYLGDDLTDEDAFRALGDRGLSVLVRGRHRSTAADLRIEPPAELLEFLDRWHRHATEV